MRAHTCAGAAFLVALSGCGAPRVTPDNDGVIANVGPCGRGLLVVESDYQSSNVSVLDYDGRVLSPSLVSSSTQASGFGVALSGGVVPPSSVQTGATIALVDSWPAGVLRFVDLARGRITAELPVGTGFKSNPQDYLALNEHKAYVPRYEANPNSGQEPFDQGADVLIVDPSTPEITGRIDLSPAMEGAPEGYSAHPAQVMRVSDRVFALLASYADDYKSGQVSRLVEIDPESDELVSTLLLPGLRGCVHMALSPDATELAIACVGPDLLAMPPKVASSGLALVDIHGEPSVVKQFAAADLGTDPVGFSLDYTAPDRLLVETLGHFDRDLEAAAQDTFLLLDAQTGGTRTVLQSLSQPFSLGGIRCAPSCGACFATDAERAGGSVLRFTVDADGDLPAPPQTLRAETRVGLPPRYLGAL